MQALLTLRPRNAKKRPPSYAWRVLVPTRASSCSLPCIASWNRCGHERETPRN